MGGIGSGNRHQSGKSTTGHYRSLDIRRLQREGLLNPGQFFGWNWTRHGEQVASIQIRTEADRVILKYRSRNYGGEWEEMEYPVYLDWTHPHLGGKRAWFLCPARGCGRRVAILYGGKIFACRHCHNLAYASQRESAHDRANRRTEKIRARLKWEPGIMNDDGWKPKGMHWRTFLRLKAEHDGYAAKSLAHLERWLKILR